jgi:GNAT superfamily N-acetyltransferase
MDAAAPYQASTRTRNEVLTIRGAVPDDENAIWALLEPIIRAGETYPLPRDMSKAAALTYWGSPRHEVFVAERDGRILGTYYLRANQDGGGSHVANCGYAVASHAEGGGIGRAMCAHSIESARGRGFHAMQFNFVIASNERAVRLWQDCGFAVFGRLPAAFDHPKLGFVDALVMYRTL